MVVTQSQNKALWWDNMRQSLGETEEWNISHLKVKQRKKFIKV